MGNSSSAIAHRRYDDRHRRRYETHPAQSHVEDDTRMNDANEAEASSTVDRGDISSDTGSPRKRNRFSTLRNPFRPRDNAERSIAEDSTTSTTSRRTRNEAGARRRRTRSVLDSSTFNTASEPVVNTSPSDLIATVSQREVLESGLPADTSHEDLPPNDALHGENGVTSQAGTDIEPYTVAAPIPSDTNGFDISQNIIGRDPMNEPSQNRTNLRSLQRDTNYMATPLQASNIPEPRPGSSRSQSAQDVQPRSGQRVLPMPGEDQAGMLSRLLSIAAAATAASLVGYDNRQALRDAREVTSGGAQPDGSGMSAGTSESHNIPASQADSDLVDGSFDGFLAALQSGRLAQALRNGGNVMGGGASEVGAQQPLNFFRMFRFSSAVSIQGSPAPTEGEGRMIPIIIVGIRSVPPIEDGAAPGDGMPPFFDTLASFEGLQARNPTATSQSEVASESAQIENADEDLGIHNSRVEETQESPTISFPPEDMIARAGSTATEGNVVSPSDLDGHTNGASSSTNVQQNSRRPSTERNDADASQLDNGETRRGARPMSGMMDSVMDRLRSFRTESPEAMSNDPENVRRRRRRPTWRPFASSGVSDEASSAAAAASANSGATRTWLIYVLGGTYPENHPILTTPSLLTDSPTYEDMLLLSNLIGPAKPETAAAADIDSAGPTYIIAPGNDQLGERCQICLAEYEEEETCRTLTKCYHYFHKDCIDEWLTTGRNNCPLCRTDTAARMQGMPEQPSVPVDSATSEDPVREATAQI